MRHCAVTTCLSVSVFAAPAHAQILTDRHEQRPNSRARPRQNRGGHCRRSTRRARPLYQLSLTAIGPSD